MRQNLQRIDRLKACRARRRERQRRIKARLAVEAVNRVRNEKARLRREKKFGSPFLDGVLAPRSTEALRRPPLTIEVAGHAS